LTIEAADFLEVRADLSEHEKEQLARIVLGVPEGWGTASSVLYAPSEVPIRTMQSGKVPRTSGG